MEPSSNMKAVLVIAEYEPLGRMILYRADFWPYRVSFGKNIHLIDGVKGNVPL